MNGERVFNTGRVQIGSAYQPKPNTSMDKDALRLQRALLGERNKIDADGLAIVAGVAIFLAVVLVPFWGA
jgi:hypothetical protein